MPACSHTVVRYLALLGCAALTAAAWTNTRLQNWDQGWTGNIFGEPTDVNTACGGSPCLQSNLKEPFPASIYRGGKICTAITGHRVLCSYLPENATLVDPLEFERSFRPLDGPTPTRRRASPSPPTNQKRSRWELDRASGSWSLIVWKKTRITFSVAAEPVLHDRIPAVARWIRDAMDMWTETCNTMGVQSRSSFFDNWHYVNATSALSEAHVWFFLSNHTVCNGTRTIACAFKPLQYPHQRTSVLINGPLLSLLDINRSLLTMAQELGHLIGLAHEQETEEKHVWNATLYDRDSIMRNTVLRLKSITASDCLAIFFYDTGFQQARPVSCKIHRTRGRICTNATIDTISPWPVKVASGWSPWERGMVARTRS